MLCLPSRRNFAQFLDWSSGKNCQCRSPNTPISIRRVLLRPRSQDPDVWGQQRQGSAYSLGFLLWRRPAAATHRPKLQLVQLLSEPFRFSQAESDTGVGMQAKGGWCLLRQIILYVLQGLQAATIEAQAGLQVNAYASVNLGGQFRRPRQTWLQCWTLFEIGFSTAERHCLSLVEI